MERKQWIFRHLPDQIYLVPFGLMLARLLKEEE